MRGPIAFLVVSLAACGSDRNPASDAGGDVDAPGNVDASGGLDAGGGIDAPPVCARPLLVGGTAIQSQGWSVQMQPPAILSYGSDYVQLHTETVSGQATGGQLLLYLPGAVPADQPFKLQIEMLVESVHVHHTFASAAAILGSYTPSSQFGTTAERTQMLFLDSDTIGWADTDLFTTSVQTSTYHTYELSVDAAGQVQVRVDGVQAMELTRAMFVHEGTIAIGDQTNDPDVDSTLRIRSVCLE